MQILQELKNTQLLSFLVVKTACNWTISRNNDKHGDYSNGWSGNYILLFKSFGIFIKIWDQLLIMWILTALEFSFAPCKGYRNTGYFCLWNPESRKILPMESRILGFGIRNTAKGIRNPTNYRNPESKFHWQILESTAWNPESKTVLDSLKWSITRVSYHHLLWYNSLWHLKMTTAQVVETSVTVNNRTILDLIHPDSTHFM